MTKQLKYLLIGALSIFIILLIMSIINQSISAIITNFIFIFIIAIQLIINKLNLPEKAKRIISFISLILLIILLIVNLFSFFNIINILKLKAM